MKTQITKKEAKAFARRWRAVNKAEIEELRRTNLSRKLQQLTALMASAKDLKLSESSAKEEKVVRERWKKLRKAFHVE